jgi:hypothetical protein
VSEINHLTTIAPIEDLAALRRRLAVVTYGPGFGRPLLELSFIHFAGWSIVTQVPDPRGKDRFWRLNHPYLLFQATFDGPKPDYLNAFADLLPLRLSRLFGACYGFKALVEDAPGAGERVLSPWAFRKYVERHELELEAAAPRRASSVDTIRQAIAIDRTNRRADCLSGVRLQRLANELERMSLGPPPERPGLRDGVVGPFVRALTRRRGVSALTILAPIVGRRGAARLTGLPDTHFARTTVIPRRIYKDDLGFPAPDELPHQYLLFTSYYDGTLEDYLERLRKRVNLAAIFTGCHGFPSGSPPRRYDLHTWVERHRLPDSATPYLVSGYPPCDVEALKEMVTRRNRIAGDRLYQGV